MASGFCIAILLRFEEFDVPSLLVFKKVALAILLIGLLPLSLLAAAAIYALHRSKKSSANIEPGFQSLERCDFCERAIESWQTPYVIKDHIVCEDCYAKIQKEKEDIGSEE
jgi:hypothetical protein